jgi:hypothetical protein
MSANPEIENYPCGCRPVRLPGKAVGATAFMQVVVSSTGGADSGMLVKCCIGNLGGPAVYRRYKQRSRDP